MADKVLAPEGFEECLSDVHSDHLARRHEALEVLREHDEALRADKEAWKKRAGEVQLEFIAASLGRDAALTERDSAQETYQIVARAGITIQQELDAALAREKALRDRMRRLLEQYATVAEECGIVVTWIVRDDIPSQDLPDAFRDLYGAIATIVGRPGLAALAAAPTEEPR